MQSIESMKCTACGAVVNPNWKECLVCDHPLNNHKHLDLDDAENLFKLLKMPLSHFKHGGYLVRVGCKHLNGEDIFIASSEKEAAVGRAEGLIVYLADELMELVKGKPSPDFMQQIHDAKQIFQGILIETREKEEF